MMSREKGLSRDAWRALALSLLFVSVLLIIFLVKVVGLKGQIPQATV